MADGGLASRGRPPGLLLRAQGDCLAGGPRSLRGTELPLGGGGLQAPLKVASEAPGEAGVELHVAQLRWMPGGPCWMPGGPLLDAWGAPPFPGSDEGVPEPLCPQPLLPLGCRRPASEGFVRLVGGSWGPPSEAAPVRRWRWTWGAAGRGGTKGTGGRSPCPPARWLPR